MHRQALRRKQYRRRQDNTLAIREVTKWLGVNRVRYARTQVTGVTRADGRNRGVPSILVMTPPPARPSVRGVAVYLWPGGYAQITESQDSWIERLGEKGWCVLLTHGADEAIAMLRELGYERGEDHG